jgi:hypothetical protein
MQVFMIIAGATFFGSLKLIFVAFVPQGLPRYAVTDFNEAKHRRDLGHVIEAEFYEVPKQEPWEPTPDQLLRTDPALALAAMRIDLERQLRRIGVFYQIVRPDQRFDIVGVLLELQRREIVPDAVANAVRDLLPVANAAVHGREVDRETAEQVLGIAREVTAFLSKK